MNFFLRARHWHLFLLMVGPILVFDLLLVQSLTSGSDISILRFFPFIMFILVFVLMGWLYTLGTKLHALLPGDVRMNLERFKLFVYIPVAYIVIIMGGLAVIMNGDFELNGLAALIIVPIHIFSMFCMFYCLYFVAKCLKAVELRRPVQFSDFLGEFFLIWFFPIGVWLIQPRINRLFKQN